MAIQSVMKALKILTSFSWKHPNLSLSEISEILKIPKPTAHGLVTTLVEAGFLKQDLATRKYALGLSVFELGMLQAETFELNQKGFSPAAKIAQATGLACRLGLWDSHDILLTATVYPSQKGAQLSPGGPRTPAYNSSLGKSVLAHLGAKELEAYLAKVEFVAFTNFTITDVNELRRDLEDTRKRGYAVDREEAVLGVACVGAPVFERAGSVVGAVSLVSSPSRILSPETLSEFGQQIIETAAEISMAMGYYPGVIRRYAPVR